MNTLKTLAVALIAPWMINAAMAETALPEVTMYKSPTCGCCGKWAEHMREAGFTVKELHSDRMDRVKAQLGIPEAMGSCHTARVGDYLVEGHVPAADVKRMLEEKPEVAGLSAPGMPQGSPGMEGPYPPDRYDVMAFERDGTASVFASH